MKFVVTLLLLAASAVAQIQATGTTGTTSTVGVAGTVSTGYGAGFYTATYSVSGSPASFSIQLESSVNNGSTYSLCGSASTTQTATLISCSGTFDRVRLNVTQLSAGSTVTWALASWYVPFQTPVNVVGTVTISGTVTLPTAVNPCLDPTQDLNSAVISAATGATTQIVALVGGQRIYPCGGTFDAAGAGTAQFVTGTNANCAAGQTNLTGNFTTALSTPIDIPAGIKIPTGQPICVVVTGVAANVNGVLIYVQK